jgi:CRP/FNR family cyclic AMP-dependent transcriptional regulator
MDFPAHLSLACQVLAAVFSLISFTRKSMRPLRAFAIFANLFFMGYAAFDKVWPVLLLHACLLPLNTKHFLDIRKLTAEIKKATVISDVSSWLLPHMTRRLCKAGEVLFRQGDRADFMIYVAAGAVRMMGVDRTIGAGELIGEIGLFSAERKRTQTLVCDTDCVLYSMTDEKMYQLYYQHPSLGFFFMQLIVGRLQRDIARERTVQAAA